MKTVVSHYGVHWANGNIAYIEQEKSGTNALGLPEKSPFLVQLAKRDRRCNHLIALAAPKPDPAKWNFTPSLTSEKNPPRSILPFPTTGTGANTMQDPA